MENLKIHFSRVFHNLPEPPNIYRMDDLEQKRLKAYVNRRSIMDLGMGLIYAALGGFFVLHDSLGYTLDFPPKPYNYIFGALCLLYGGFRIYRGIKKNYYR